MHVVARAPIVLIANTVLRAAGYSEFTRAVAPAFSPSSRHSVPLNPSTIYEILGNPKPGRFNLRSANGDIITSADSARHNTTEVLGSFFDLEKIQELCDERGLVFQERYDTLH
jgi:hypothetical protein